MPSVTQAEFARLLGVAKPYINKLVTTGVLTLDADGRLDADASIEILKARASPGHQLSRLSEDDTPAMKTIRGGDDDAPPADESVGTGSFQQARTRREHFAALNEQLKYDRELGTLVDAAGVQRACKTAARLVRDNLLAIPDRIAAELAADADPRSVRAILHRHLSAALDRTIHALENAGMTGPAHDDPPA
jgi:phage terminase Nu1 subunit (DNA packaging protein)